MAENDISIDVKDGIGTITLNRPDHLNAFTISMILELVDALKECNENDDVRVVIVTGAGRTFSAGADLSGGLSNVYADMNDPELRNDDGSFNYSADTVRDDGGRITLQLFEMNKPVIGAVNGHAVGMGVSMLLPMDFRFASDKAKFAMPFVRRGICAESTVSFFLSRLVGLAKASDWLLTGRTFLADEALEAGLVSKLYAPEDVLPAAQKLAKEIVENTAPVSVALTRQMLWKGLTWDHPMEAHIWESRGMFTRTMSADTAEGAAAFFEKRPPNFSMTVSKDMPDFFPWWSPREYK